LDKSAADASLKRKLANLRRDDQSWCVLTEVPKNGEIRYALDALEPTLGELIRAGDGFELAFTTAGRSNSSTKALRFPAGLQKLSQTLS
jgi:hypothetical protein